MHTAMALLCFMAWGNGSGTGNRKWETEFGTHGLGCDRLIYFLCHLELWSGSGRMETSTKSCTSSSPSIKINRMHI